MSRMLRLAIVLLALAIFVIPALPASAAPTNSKAVVSGTVLGSDGAAVPGAIVNVYLEKNNATYSLVDSIVAGSSGSWTFMGKAGTYRFDFAASSCDPRSEPLSVIAAQTYTLNVTLTSYGSVAGVVTDSASGSPIVGATVGLYRLEAGVWPTTPSVILTTGSSGDYASGQILAGQYRVRASAPSYVPKFYGESDLSGPMTVAVGTAADVTGIDISLLFAAQTGSIRGQVVKYSSRTPVPNTYVWFYKQNDDGTWPATSPGWGDPTKTAITDASGNYDSGELPVGNYLVRFWGGSMIGSQFWQYVATVDLATVVPLASGETVTGIDGWFLQTL